MCAFVGYIFVTRKQMGWVVGGGGMGYIFITRDEECVIVVVRREMCGLHFVTRNETCVAVVVGSGI